MKKFLDDEGNTWVASVRARPGEDYKGRYCLLLRPENAPPEEGVELSDVRWNSRRTAERTLKTMSVTELRRRHRWAMGRVA